MMIKALRREKQNSVTLVTPGGQKFVSLNQEWHDDKRQLESTFSQLQAELENANSEIRTELENANSEIRTELENANSEIRTELENANSEIRTELENANSEIRTELENANSEIRTELENVNSETRTELENANSEIRTELENVNSEIRTENLELATTLEQGRENLRGSARRERAAKNEAEFLSTIVLNRLEKEVAELEQRLEESESARREAEAVLAAALTSSSWRLTAPLRWLADTLLGRRSAGKSEPAPKAS